MDTYLPRNVPKSGEILGNYILSAHDLTFDLILSVFSWLIVAMLTIVLLELNICMVFQGFVEPDFSQLQFQSYCTGIVASLFITLVLLLWVWGSADHGFPLNLWIWSCFWGMSIPSLLLAYTQSYLIQCCFHIR